MQDSLTNRVAVGKALLTVYLATKPCPGSKASLEVRGNVRGRGVDAQDPFLANHFAGSATELLRRATGVGVKTFRVRPSALALRA